MIDSMVGHTDKHGLDLWLGVNHSTRVFAHPSQIPGEIIVKLGDGFGQGLALAMPERIADMLVDSLVDALDAARQEAAKKLLAQEDANADR